MLLIDIQNVSKYIGSEVLFEQVSFQIHQGDKIGVVGKNGSGKTTLVKMIIGEDLDYQGHIKAHCDMGYIEQLSFEGGGTRSGGEFTKQKIYDALRQDALLLIADEPTCNLDLESIVHLEKQLKRVKSCLLISHDETLLESICNKIIAIDDHKVKLYNIGYDGYKELVRNQNIQVLGTYKKFIVEKKQIIRSIQKTNKRANSVKEAKEKMGNSEARLHKREAGERRSKIEAHSKAIKTRLSQLDIVEKPYEYKQVQIKVPNKLDLHTSLLISGQHIDKSFGEKIIFNDAKFQLLNKEKLWLRGRNGSGKSTLIQMICREDVVMQYAKNLKIGYFDQKLEKLNYDNSIFENIMTSTQRQGREIRHILANMLFKEQDVNKPLHVLSGGELVKVAFSKVLLSDINLLVLDEPTNYLDVDTRKTMLEALQMYTGTIIFVTHDRHFGNALATVRKTIKNGLIL